MRTTKLTLERLSDFAVLLVALVVIGCFVKHEFTPRRGSALPQAQAYVGKRIQLSGMHVPVGQKSIVLGISAGCHFCSENAAFYRTLSRIRQQDRLYLIALLPEPVQTSTAYLKEKGIGVDQLISGPLSDASIAATPTLLLLNSDRRIQKAWIGALDERSQQDVLQSIHQSHSSNNPFNAM